MKLCDRLSESKRAKSSQSADADGVRSGRVKIGRSASAAHGVIRVDRVAHAAIVKRKVETKFASRASATRNQCRIKSRLSKLSHDERAGADGVDAVAAVVEADAIESSNHRPIVAASAANAPSVRNARSVQSTLNAVIALNGARRANGRIAANGLSGAKVDAGTAGDVVEETRQTGSADRLEVARADAIASQCASGHLMMNRALSQKCEKLRQNQHRHAKRLRSRPL